MLRLRRDIPLFPGGKKKALTLSYDDGVTQDEHFIKLLDKYGVKCTFNLNSGLLGNKDTLVQSGVEVTHHKIEKDKIAEVYQNHEIAVHSASHPDLVRIPDGMIAYEIAECRKVLEEIVHRPITGMAYPFGTWNDRAMNVAQCCGITYARTTKQNFSFELPENFLVWHPTCHHTEREEMFELLTKFVKTIADKEYRTPWVYYLWGHTYEFDVYDEWEIIERFLKEASGKEDVWYASNGEIREYVAALEQLVYSASGDYIFNPNCCDIWLMIDQKSYHIPSGSTVAIENIS